MCRVLGGQIGLDDIIFVHRAATDRKQVEMRKADHSLGLTIADNGNGRSYIKHIRPDSPASRVPFIQPGDHIEAIENQSYIGYKHSEVAAALRAIPLEKVFTITLVEPRRPLFILPKSDQKLSLDYKHYYNEHSHELDDECNDKANNNEENYDRYHNGNGNRSYGMHPHKVEHDLLKVTKNHEKDDKEQRAKVKALDRIAAQLEHFIGVSDSALALELYDAANDRLPKEFAATVATGPLGDFCFPAHVLAIVWNSVNFPP